MAELWPADVPTAGLIDGYSEEDEDNNASFKPEVGPELARRRALTDIEMVQATIPMTYAQYDTLKTFRRQTLRSGTLPTITQHPRSGVTITARLTRVGSPRNVNHLECHVPIELMVFVN